MSRRLFSLLMGLIYLSCSLLTGCVSSMLGGQPSDSFSEQLYIDARLDFAIKHPLDWQRLKIPVSSPQYRADTVRWQVKAPQTKKYGGGEMLIRSLPADPGLTLPELLSSYLENEPELKTGKVEKMTLPAGPALKLLGHDVNRGHLTIALKGQARDFILSLDFPSDRFAELLPTFQDIVDSFVEVVRPAKQKK